MLSATTLSGMVTFNHGGGEVTVGQSAKQVGYVHILLASVVNDNARLPLLPHLVPTSVLLTVISHSDHLLFFRSSSMLLSGL